MQELVREYLGELRSKRRKRRRISVAVTLLAVMVVGGVIGALVQYGVAMTGDAKCGMEEHTHSEVCYADALVCGIEESEGHQHTDACYQIESTLICGQEEYEASEESEVTEESAGHVHEEECYVNEQILICGQEENEGHTHTDACNEKQLACGRDEHTHTDACYIDTTADIEDSSVWDALYENTEWKGVWGEDLVTAAKAQIGYKESSKNYVAAGDGNHKGYTRYGQFAVNAGVAEADVYADWDAVFVNFCMHYAGLLTSNLFPGEKDTAEWYNKFIQADEANQNYIFAPDGYEPKAGDLIFLQKEGEETAFQMGIISSVNKEKNEIEVIEGNCGNEVRENKYDVNDASIHSYLKITELETAYKGNEEEENFVEESPAEQTEEQISPAYEAEYDADAVVIHVTADAGVIPDGAELSVTPIEKKEITRDMSEEEKEEAEKVNEQYEMTSEKLNEESEKNEQKLEGFLAYDICFMLDGNEVEPNGEVKVTMNFKEAVIPEEVSKDATVAVNHLKESEDGGVKVENLTEADTTNIETTEEDAAVEKVELVADNFSIFTIIWQWDMSGNIIPMGNLAVEFVDEEGETLKPKDKESMAGNIELNFEPGKMYDLKDAIGNKWTSIVVVEDSGEAIYEPVKMWISNKIEVEKVQFNNSTWEFKDSSDNRVFDCDPMSILQYPLQIVFRRMQAAEIKIDNDIKRSGNLTAVLSGNALTAYNEAVEKNSADNDQDIRYVWYKAINRGEYEEVANVKYDDDMYVITGDYGNSLNVALDGGMLSNENQSVEYKVELYIGGELIGGSMPESITYYGELQNGSFEEPLVTSEGNTLYHYFEQDHVKGWKTTAVESNGAKRIEIARVVDGRIDNYYGDVPGGFSAADGDQFAELNAVTQGSLYQDVLTVKGVQLNYSFSHRARPNTGNDEMYLVIVPTLVAENGVPGGSGEIDTQDEVKYLIAHRNDKNESGEFLYPGVYVQNYTVDSSRWVEHSGIYTPQYNLNRFFFVSNASDPSMGNFIDNVWFSQRLPDPKEDTFNFRIVKTIKGLKEIDEIEDSVERINTLKNKIKSLTFDISIENVFLAKSPLDGYIPKELKAEEMEWTDNGNGSYTGVHNYYNIPIDENVYRILVEEKNADIEPYGLKTTVTRVSSGKQETPTAGMLGEVQVKKNSQERLIFENVYEEKDNSTWQVVKRSFSDKAKKLEGAVFTLTSTENPLTDVLTGETDNNGVIQWKKNGGSADLNDLNGEYIIKETKAPEGYSCSEKEWTLVFNNGKLDAAALTQQIEKDKDFIVLKSENNVHEISIYNTLIYELPSTGGSGIYWYMFSGILLMAGAALITYKKRCREVLRS